MISPIADPAPTALPALPVLLPEAVQLTAPPPGAGGQPGTSDAGSGSVVVRWAVVTVARVGAPLFQRGRRPLQFLPAARPAPPAVQR